MAVYTQTTSGDVQVPIPGLQESDIAEELRQGDVLDSVISALLRGLVGAAGDAIIAGCTITAGAGLSVDVVAGSRALIDFVHVYSAPAVNKAGLTNAMLNYIYLQWTDPDSKADRTFTVVSNTTGVPPALSILIATATCAGGIVTAVDNDPTGRPGQIVTRSIRKRLNLVANQIAYTLPVAPRSGSIDARINSGPNLWEGTAAQVAAGTADFSVSGVTLTLAPNWAPALSFGFLVVEYAPA